MTAEPPLKQIILAAHFPGVNNTTVWSDPRPRARSSSTRSSTWPRPPSGASSTSSSSPRACAFASSGARSTTSTSSADPTRWPCSPPWPVVTTHLGLAGTLNATFHEPYELARQLATLDHLSGGRAAWNVVTSSDAFTGENFRRGGFLDYADRYVRAGEFIRTARELWDSWADDEIVADVSRAGSSCARGRPARSTTTASSSTSTATSPCPAARRATR